ncbi:hypothetical protein SDC9_193100 [bioreactor metagenome]|uniref:Uncharacterized protein n=1 Tax=bioreactor metagenome TaxID=1076179 RepID=A0A645IDN7_9ZZZZ
MDYFRNLFGSELPDRITERLLFASNPKGCHHHFAQRFSTLLHDNVDGPPSSNGYLLRYIAYIGKDKCYIGEYVYSVIPIHIGDSALRGSLHNDTDPNKRHPVSS